MEAQLNAFSMGYNLNLHVRIKTNKNHIIQWEKQQQEHGCNHCHILTLFTNWNVISFDTRHTHTHIHVASASFPKVFRKLSGCYHHHQQTKSPCLSLSLCVYDCIFIIQLSIWIWMQFKLPLIGAESYMHSNCWNDIHILHNASWSFLVRALV